MASLEDVGSRIPVLGAAMGWTSDAEKNLQDQMKLMQAAYQNYRPIAAQARNQQLAGQLQAWAPVSQWAAQMTGGQPYDPSQMQQAFKDLSTQATQVGTYAEPTPGAVLQRMGIGRPPRSDSPVPGAVFARLGIR